MESTNPNWSKAAQYIAGLGLALFGIFVLYLSRSVIPLLIVAGLIAVIVRPLILWLYNSVHLPRSLSVILIYLILAILFPLALILVMPVIINAGEFLQNLDYTSIIQNFIAWLRDTLIAIKTQPLPTKVLSVFIGQTIDSILKTLDQTTIPALGLAPVDSNIQSIAETLSITFRTATGVVSSLVSSTAQLFFTFLASVYISLSAHAFNDAILRVAPKRFRPELAILIDRIERTWKAFFRGELTLMLFIGVITWMGLTILGVPGAPYLGIVAGLFEIIPNIGPVLSAIPAIIIVLFQGSTYLQVSPLFMALLVILLYILVQLFENNLLVPKVLGKAVNLPVLVVMTGVLVGAEVGGLLGLLLATPVIATVRDIVCYIHHKILGENPFPYEEELQKPTALPPTKPWNRRTRTPGKIKLFSKGTRLEPYRPTEIKPTSKK
ncbi:MAG TPA: AI-2E family transporter [Longilinea sp.]|nr:AI-2E family transporter [Longilinea sp.]